MSRRVLHVTGQFFPVMGGIESHVYEVTRRLPGLGWDCAVLTTDNTHALPRTDEVDGIPVTRVRAWPRRRDWRCAPGLVPAVRRARPDLVHVQGVHTLVPAFAMLAALLARVPYVVTFHTGGHSSAARVAVRGLQWRLLRPLLARAERLVCVASFERDHFASVLRLPANRFDVVPNGGRLPDVGPGLEMTPEPTVLCVGRLERYKGQHRLLAAWPAVLRQIPDARLLLIGSGPEEAALHRQAADLRVGSSVEIRAIDPRDRAEMARTVASAHVFALLSTYEAHPVAVMEAISLGRPALVTATSGLQELADKGWAQSVALATPADAVAERLVDLLRHPV
ncbi:MAG: glycosyltransferase family 4 protein, partial [Sporichthyaceae bacterium]